MLRSMALASTALLAAMQLAGCESEKEVSYSKDVVPLVNANCMECHQEGGTGQVASGLGMATYEELMAGTKFGPVIVPGDGLNSVFNQVVEGRVDESIAMPHGGKGLAEVEEQVLRTWVDQGAKNN